MAGILLSKIKLHVRQAQVMYEGDALDFGYYPGEFTPELAGAVDTAVSTAQVDVIAVLMEPLMAWWDILNDDESRMPTDAETINRMPIALLVEILRKIGESMRPPESKP
jgi:hypothetical protein